MVLVCHLYVDGKLVEWGHLPATEMVDPDHVGEMEIAGKFCRGEDGGPPHEYPFYFGESDSCKSWSRRNDLPVLIWLVWGIDSPIQGPAAREHIGTIRAVVFWAHPDLSAQHDYPAPDKSFADGLRDHYEQPRPLRMGDAAVGHDRSCVRISAQGKPTRVVEQSTRLRPEGESGYAFVFHYAHPGLSFLPFASF